MDLLSGTDIADAIADKETVGELDKFYASLLVGGMVPGYISDTVDWPILTSKNAGHTLEFATAPDYGSFGKNSDYFRIGKSSQKLTQKYVEKYDAIMPSAKLLKIIQAAADPKINYIPVQKSDTTEDSSTAGLIRSNRLANEAFAARGIKAAGSDSPRIGYRKAYIVRPNLTGAYIAIFGGRKDAGGTIVQGHSGDRHTEATAANGWTYSGPSHGIVLVANQATLDGDPVHMRDVFMSKDPGIWGLVSDEGPFDPVFPNAGTTGTISKMAFDRFSGGDTSAAGEARAVAAASGGAGAISGAILGLAGALALSIPVPWVIAGPAVGAILGRIFGQKLFS